jgi:hypothetical protein
MNELKTYLTEHKADWADNFEDHLKSSNSYRHQKILNVCTSNDYDILNLNLFNPPGRIDPTQFLDILITNLNIIRDLKVGDIVMFNKNGVFYETGVYTGKVAERRLRVLMTQDGLSAVPVNTHWPNRLRPNLIFNEFQDKSRCRIVYCNRNTDKTPDDYFIWNRIRHGNLLELAANSQLEIANAVYESTFDNLRPL